MTLKFIIEDKAGKLAGANQMWGKPTRSLLNTYILFIVFFWSADTLLIGQNNSLVSENEMFCRSIAYLDVKNDKSDSDLFFLDSILGTQAIIILGEESHLDGATDDLKIRVIKYLHEKMDFNVLVDENSAFSCDYFFEMLKLGNPAHELVARNLSNEPGFYNRSDSVKYSYIQEQTKGSKPLKYTGMDVFSFGSPIDFEFYDALTTILINRNVISDKMDPTLNKMFELHADILKKTRNSNSRFKSFTKLVNYFEKKIDSVTQLNLDKPSILAELGIVKKYLKDFSYGLDFRRTIYKVFKKTNVGPVKPTLEVSKIILSTFRDSLMSENIRWLKENRFKGEKIIIDCSNIHAISSSFSSLACNKNITKHLKNTKTLGYYLKKVYGDELYSIATITYEGSNRKTVENSNVCFHPIEGRSPQTLESKLSSKCRYGFVDFHQPYFEYIKCFTMFPTFDKEYELEWQKLYDGVFYIKSMYPHSKIRLLK